MEGGEECVNGDGFKSRSNIGELARDQKPQFPINNICIYVYKQICWQKITMSIIYFSYLTENRENLKTI